jgi:ABC-type maltose transport system permease subunit
MSASDIPRLLLSTIVLAGILGTGTIAFLLECGFAFGVKEAGGRRLLAVFIIAMVVAFFLNLVAMQNGY